MSRGSVLGRRQESLESRLCLSTITFVESEIDSNEVISPPETVLADLDNDGDLDVLSGAHQGYRIAWKETSNSEYAAWHVVGESTPTSGAVIDVADVDNDGDADIVASINANTVAWFENDGQGVFQGPTHLFQDTGIRNGWTSITFEDFDGDGDQDVLSVPIIGAVRWHENVDGFGEFSRERVVRSGAQTDSNRAVSIADYDADGDADVILSVFSASSLATSLVYFENQLGSLSNDRVIHVRDGGVVRALASGDIDGDGLLDLVAGSVGVAWQKNLGGGSFHDPVAISDDHVFAVATGDFNSDGDIDLALGITDEVSIDPQGRTVVLENVDGRGAFVEAQTVIGTGGTTFGDLVAVDADLDSDLDLVITSSTSNLITRIDNTDAMGTFREPKAIASSNSNHVHHLESGDIDGDGDIDIMMSAFSHRSILSSRVTWYENRGDAFASQTIISRQSLTSPFFLPKASSLSDVDGDGDLDVVVAWYGNEYSGGEVVWYENTDGAGEFSMQKNIGIVQTLKDNNESLWVGDYDGDGDRDVVVAVGQRNLFAFENDGSQVFQERQIDSLSLSSIESVVGTDLNDDGRIDWLVTTSGGGLGWIRTDGTRLEGVLELGNNLGDLSVVTADADGDGDLDVLAAYSGGIQIYENIGQNRFSDGRQLSIHSGFTAIAAVDADGDQDIDLIAARAAGLEWYSNSGDGHFGPPNEIDPSSAPIEALVVGDLDLDQDLDIVAASPFDGRIVGYIDRLIGDVNDDGVFDSADFVQVFTTGEYEDGVADNSTYEDGDWNGDGEFDSSDLVFAFQAGTYSGAASAFHQSLRSTLAAAVDAVFDIGGPSKHWSDRDGDGRDDSMRCDSSWAVNKTGHRCIYAIASENLMTLRAE